MLSYSPVLGVPPIASKNRSWASISVSNRSSDANQTKLQRLKPSVATKADNGSRPRRIVVQSICACWPGGVSKRLISGAATGGRSARSQSFRIEMPPS
jgi:hypothetical protein